MPAPQPSAEPPRPITSGIRRALRGIYVGNGSGESQVVEEALRRAGYEPVIMPVDTAAALRRELGRGRWEMVFADCRMAGFDCSGAIAILREVGLDLPVIVISGSIGDDQAAAIMKAGAHDFIRKDQLTRLPGAVARELAEARIRRAHRKALAELADTSARLATLVEAAPLAVVELDAGSHVRRWNSAAQRIFGWGRDEVLGQPLPVVPGERRSDFIAMCAEVHAGRSFTGVEVRWDRKDGAGVELALSLAPLPGGLLLMASKKCDMARLQHRLDRAQHHQTIGQLASGLAQEIGAPLAVAEHEVDFLTMAFEELALVVAAHRDLAAAAREGRDLGEIGRSVAAICERIDLDFLLLEIPRALAKAKDGNERMGRIVRAMGEAGRSSGNARESVDLNRAVECAATVARSEFRHVADLVLDLQPDLPAVECDQGEITYVLLNLMVNAAHAVAESAGSRGRGVITVSTRDAGDGIEAQVHDTGPGMADEVARRVFEPFFTTKPVGKGTGQGLATSRAIVERHRGSLTFESARGAGTAFTLRLPRRPAAG